MDRFRPKDNSYSNTILTRTSLTDARIPEIVKHIDGQTIIYTEYVTNVIETFTWYTIWTKKSIGMLPIRFTICHITMPYYNTASGVKNLRETDRELLQKNVYLI